MLQPLSERARGRWRDILPELGIAPQFLTGHHGPCPICGEGRDRFRFDDREGRGTWICSRCGAGDGVSLVMQVHRLDFRGAAERIEAAAGHARREPVRIATLRSERQQKDACRRVWLSSEPVTVDTPAGQYLRSRIGIDAFPADLRAVERLRYQGTEPRWFPGLVALVRGPDGVPATMHRTYLAEDGAGKAAVEKPRMLMPGPIPKGAAIRLGAPADRLGIAEGIETALAASALFSVPCWAAVSARMLEQWLPPDDMAEVIIFGDHDANFTGQSAAYRLANRLATAKRSVRVEIPPDPGDWNDVLLARRATNQ